MVSVILVVVGVHLLTYGGLASTVDGGTLRNHTSYNLRWVIAPLLVAAAVLAGGLRSRAGAWRVFCCTYVAVTAGCVWIEHYAWQRLRFTSEHNQFLALFRAVAYAPFWAAVASTIAFGVTRLLPLLLRRRRVPGVCCGCGYDMRATPDRCPECGLASAAR